LTTGLLVDDLAPLRVELADLLFAAVPAGVGSTGRLRLSGRELDEMLARGAEWAVAKGYGHRRDLTRIEEQGRMAGAEPEQVSEQARERQRDEMGTLGAGNHYLEVQRVAAIYDREVAARYGLRQDGVLVSIHCGSRGLGHQVGTDYMKIMGRAATRYGIELPDRELACAPLQSPEGQAYLGAMRAAINCALANRQILTHLVREVFACLLPRAELELLYDVSHNTCKEEEHPTSAGRKRLFVHRKGATRAFGPGHPELCDFFRPVGQPVLVGGSMGTASYILAGAGSGEEPSRAFNSACHGAGRAMSRHQAGKTFRGRQVVDELAARNILIRASSLRGVAEEAPGAYKDIDRVVEVAHQAGLARKVARLEPLICVKG